jgi:hypothetical protein
LNAPQTTLLQTECFVDCPKTSLSSQIKKVPTFFIFLPPTRLALAKRPAYIAVKLLKPTALLGNRLGGSGFFDAPASGCFIRT